MEPTFDAIVSPSTSTNGYLYEVLPDARSFLRLLEFEAHGISEDGEISCRLNIWPINEAPIYYAASYTWGDSAMNEEIQLNGQTMVVRKNCADVLRQLWYFKTTRYYWIDALCINQDDLEEKAAQVAMMGIIFWRANHVLACIGLEDEDGATYAIQRLIELNRNSKRLKCPRRGFRAGIRLREELTQMLISLPRMDVVRFALAFSDLAQRSYFKRIWIVQEFLLARQVTICCGYSRVHADSLDWCSAALRNHQVQQWPELRAVTGESHRYPLVAPSDPLGLHLVSGLLARKRPRRYTSELQYPFDAILSVCVDRQCSDPRDTVYALLPLIYWYDKKPIKPDYGKTVYSLAEEVLQCFGTQAIGSDLFTNLKLDQKSDEVSSGLKIRRTPVDIAIQLIQPATSPSRHRMIELTHYGYSYQILSPMDELVLHDEFGKEYIEFSSLDENGAKQLSGLLPPFTEYGDWIFTDCPTNGLVLRWTGTKFAILGRAWLKKPEIHYESHRNLKLLYDPDDLIVYYATRFALTMDLKDNEMKIDILDGLGITVCKSPFSSFAELVSYEASD